MLKASWLLQEPAGDNEGNAAELEHYPGTNPLLPYQVLWDT